MHVVVIGAGIAGLGAAYELRKHGVAVTLLEQAAEVGGRCRSFSWHGQWHHTGAEALISGEQSLSALRVELDRAGAAPSVDLSDWDTVHGERIYFRGKTLDVDFFSPLALWRLPGPLRDKLALARLLPLVIKQRRHHDSNDFTSTAWLDDRDGASYLRGLAPDFYDHTLEPFLQYTTLDAGDYGLAWLLFAAGDLSWMKAWWAYAERGSGGVTYELGRALDRDLDCDLRLSTRVDGVALGSNGMVVFARSPTGRDEIEADAVIVAVPGSAAGALLGDLASPSHHAFLGDVSYVAHHFGRYLVNVDATDLPRKVLLPAVEGFHRVAKVTVSASAGGTSIITADIKDRYARTVGPDDEDRALDDAWDDVVQAFPQLKIAKVGDRVFTRNDIALCRRPAGYAKSLKTFLELPAIPRVHLAGDYLLQSTVGGAHFTGVQAAKRVLALQRGSSSAT